jgi:uncharacterized protein YraI
MAVTHTRSEWINKFDALDAATNSGNGYSTDSDSGQLAWAESMFLMSYLNMYEATKNNSYLEKFITHVDNMVVRMDDPTNDGYDGWDTYSYSVNLVANEGAEELDVNDIENAPSKLDLVDNLEFSDPSDSTLPDGWVRCYSTSSTAYIDINNAYSGTYGCTVKTNPGSGWEIIERVLPAYEPGATYLVTFYGKVTGTGTDGRLDIYDETAPSTLKDHRFTNTGWKKQLVVFTAPSTAGHTIKLRFYHGDHTVSSFYTHFDNIEIYKGASLADDLEFSDSSDSTLPDGWVRWSSTSSTAYIDSSNAYSGTYGCTVKANPSSGWEVIEKVLPAYEPGETYLVTFYGKITGTGTEGRLDVYDETAPATLKDYRFTNTSWEKQSIIFTAPSSAGHTIKLRFYHGDHTVSNFYTHFDNVRVYEAVEALDNIDFTDQSDSTLPEGWGRWGATSSTAYIDSSNAYSGRYGCTVKTNPGAGWEILEKVLPAYEPDAIYIVTFYGKVTGTGTEGRLDIYDETAPATLKDYRFKNTSWENQSVMFTAPSAGGHTIKLRFYHGDHTVSNFYTHFDNVNLYKANYLKMLPAYWHRWQATPTENAYANFSNDDSQDVKFGKLCFSIKTAPALDWQVLQTELENTLVDDNKNYEPGFEYKVYFKAKVEGNTDWRFSVYDFTDNVALLNMTGANTDWSSFSGTFTAPAGSGHDVKVRLYHSSKTAIATSYFDDINVKQYAEHQVHDGMIAIPIAKFIMMAKRGLIPDSIGTAPDVIDITGTYGKANEYLDIIEDHLISKWDQFLEVIDSTKSVYVHPDDGSSVVPNISLPHNQYLAHCSVYAYLSCAGLTNSSSYADLATKLANTFADYLTVVDNDEYKWNYRDIIFVGDITNGIEDTSHGSIDINSIVSCNYAGIVFDRTDMQYFANTFANAMWNQSLSNPLIDDKVDGSLGSQSYQYNTWGWIQLGIADCRAYDIIRTMHDLIWSDTTYMTWRRMLVISEIVKGVPVVYDLFDTPDSSDSTLPEGWSRYQSSSNTAYLDDYNAFTGECGVRIKTDSSLWQVIEKSFTYTPGAAYKITFMGKTNNVVGGYVDIYDSTDSNQLGNCSFYNTDWEQKTINFTAPANSGNTVKIRLYSTSHTVSGGEVYYDNIDLREIE